MVHVWDIVEGRREGEGEASLKSDQSARTDSPILRSYENRQR
jgi:hypothetical protein